MAGRNEVGVKEGQIGKENQGAIEGKEGKIGRNKKDGWIDR